MNLKKLSRGIAAILVVLLLLVVSSCDQTIPSKEDDTSGEMSSVQSSPYHAMQAYVADVSCADGVGAEESAWQVEFEHVYPKLTGSYNDESMAGDRKVYTDGDTHCSLLYQDSWISQYRLYDRYLCEENQKIYNFERATGDFVGVYEEISSEESCGEGFASNELLIAHAEDLVTPYIAGDISMYEVSVRTVEYSGFNDYYLLWKYKVNGIAVSSIYAIVTDCGALVRVDISQYRENAEEIDIKAGTDASCREIIASRIESEAAEQEAAGDPVGYLGYSIGEGCLLYDDTGRPFVMYSATFTYQMGIDSITIDFILYLE